MRRVTNGSPRLIGSEIQQRSIFTLLSNDVYSPHAEQSHVAITN